MRIEVKWTTMLNQKDIQHIIKFQNEYKVAKYGYVICQTPYPMELSDTVMAISWRDLAGIIK